MCSSPDGEAGGTKRHRSCPRIQPRSAASTGYRFPPEEIHRRSRSLVVSTSAISSSSSWHITTSKSATAIHCPTSRCEGPFRIAAEIQTLASMTTFINLTVSCGDDDGQRETPKRRDPSPHLPTRLLRNRQCCRTLCGNGWCSTATQLGEWCQERMQSAPTISPKIAHPPKKRCRWEHHDREEETIAGGDTMTRSEVGRSQSDHAGA